MTFKRIPKRHAVLAALMATVSCLVALPGAQAQQLYRSVGPDGKVTFSDKPPVETAPPGKASASAPRAGQAAPATAGAPLPFELKQVASRFPVTLYTSNDCSPCGTARAFLSSRGVPFTERTIVSNDDIDALKRLSGDASLPFATIGGQQLKGFSDVEWGQFIDAAGYPKTSALPAAYRNPPATPLVAVQARTAASEPAAAAPRAQAPAPEPAPPAPAPANPSGFRF